MNLWMVRGGKSGEQEGVSLEKGLACIGFHEVPDLSKAVTKADMRKLLEKALPDASKHKVSNFLGQLHQFAHSMETGDIVVMPLRNDPLVAVGRVAGRYKHRVDLGEIHHTREVQWVRPDVPRSHFKQDLLYAMGVPKTVCKIERNESPKRVEAVLAGGLDPGTRGGGNDEIVDLAEVARDQLRSHVERHFKGHALARLADAVLQAEGYVTHLSTPGPDGGVDILARRGPLGFDGPRLCVQVKSSTTAADVTVLRGLQGSMATFKAEEGLLVSWGGFNRAVRNEARLSFFSVRLWDADDLLTAIGRNYERLPDDLRSELPLKRLWVLVTTE